MAEYTNALAQTVAAGQNVQFSDTVIRCTKGYVQHREGSGVFVLRGITNNCFARYRIQFDGNIAVPTGGTVEPITISVAVQGEPLLASTAIVTPVAVEQYSNVGIFATVDVPKGCCVSVAIENTTDEAILVQNANLEITRTA